MDSIRFPSREYFPLYEVPSTNTTSTTSFSSHPEKEVLIAIPNGKKSYLWFTNTGNDVCFSVPRNFKTQPQWTEVSTQITTQFPQPFYGTLLSGTFVYPPGNLSSNGSNTVEYFVADDIFYYAGISLSKSTFAHRLEYLCTFFHQYISTTPITPQKSSSQNKQIEIVLVNMRGRNEVSVKPIYRVHHWQLRNLSLVTPYYALSFEPSSTNNIIQPNIPTAPSSSLDKSITIQKSHVENTPPPVNVKKQWIFQYNLNAYEQKVIFKIVPEEQCDVYTIYAREPNINYENSQPQIQWVSCGYAGIFQYSTSKFLNYHCRNITSDHLDQIEESDDEEETPLKPPTGTPTAQYFECIFSPKFRKWIPMHFVPQCSPEKVISIDKLAYYGENRPSRYKQTPHYHSQPHSKNRHISKYK